MNDRSLCEFENVTGIVFRDRSLLREAFVHSSYANEAPPDQAPAVDNERLEFLGDAVLGFVVSQHLFEEYPASREGELTRLRASLVRRETLARVARAKHLGDYLVLGKGEQDTGGRKRDATLCATYEAVVGAIYLDQGLDAVEAFVLPDLMAELEIVRRSALSKDAKSRLQEWTQREYGVAPRYRVLESSGPDHAKAFAIEVTVMGHRCGVGSGKSKQEASQQAANGALALLGISTWPESTPVDRQDERWPIEDGVVDLLRAAADANHA